jgi:hypothetical protein
MASCGKTLSHRKLVSPWSSGCGGDHRPSAVVVRWYRTTAPRRLRRIATGTPSIGCGGHQRGSMFARCLCRSRPDGAFERHRGDKAQRACASAMIHSASRGCNLALTGTTTVPATAAHILEIARMVALSTIVPEQVRLRASARRPARAAHAHTWRGVPGGRWRNSRVSRTRASTASGRVDESGRRRSGERNDRVLIAGPYGR